MSLSVLIHPGQPMGSIYRVVSKSLALEPGWKRQLCQPKRVRCEIHCILAPPSLEVSFPSWDRQASHIPLFFCSVLFFLFLFFVLLCSLFCSVLYLLY